MTPIVDTNNITQNRTNVKNKKPRRVFTSGRTNCFVFELHVANILKLVDATELQVFGIQEILEDIPAMAGSLNSLATEDSPNASVVNNNVS